MAQLIVLTLLAGIISAYQDRCTKKSQFEESLLAQYEWKVFHPDLSWRNKHKRGSFWTPFADGFHYLKTVQLILWCLVPVFAVNLSGWYLALFPFAAYFTYVVAHNVYYHQVITQKWRMYKIFHAPVYAFVIWPFIKINKILF